MVKPLSHGTLALCMVNFGDKRNEMSLQFWDLGIPYAANMGLEMYNCYTKENEGKFSERYVAVLEPHDSLVLIAKPVKLK
jgi:alpha-galactosidase